MSLDDLKALASVDEYRRRFADLKERMPVKDMLPVLVEHDDRFNQVLNGKYNDFRNVTLGKAAILPTCEVVMVLEQHLLERQQPNKRYLSKIRVG